MNFRKVQLNRKVYMQSVIKESAEAKEWYIVVKERKEETSIPILYRNSIKCNYSSEAMAYHSKHTYSSCIQFYSKQSVITR